MKIVLSIFLSILEILVLVVCGWFLAQAWNMFISPSFSLPEIDYAIGVGIYLFYQFLILHERITEEVNRHSEDFDSWIRSFFRVSFTLLIYALLYGVSLIYYHLLFQ